jgi:hypothetical protein
MRRFRSLVIAICAAVVFLALGPSVRSSLADEWNRKTVVNFPVPVEIPGQILPPGTYVFKLVNLPDTRNVVEIQNQDESFTFATLQAINTWRSRPTNHTRFLFDERSGDQPEASQTWYCPGDTRGLDFIYPAYEYTNALGYESSAGR